jgi:hypothetical protein
MSGIITTLKTYDVVTISSKKVRDFTFAFISPLGADYDSSLRNFGFRHQQEAWFENSDLLTKQYLESKK